MKTEIQVHIRFYFMTKLSHFRDSSQTKTVILGHSNIQPFTCQIKCKRFLFIIMMTVLMADARRDLEAICNIKLSEDMVCHECLYADDTLLIDVPGSNLQKYMECVAEHGNPMDFV